MRVDSLAYEAGTPEERREAREALRREQLIRAAHRHGWEELPRSELQFGRVYVVHEPTGALFLPALGEVAEGTRNAADAYYIARDGTPAFLKRPGRQWPQTLAELEQRRARPKPGRRRP
jgi:hypothetical protein